MQFRSVLIGPLTAALLLSGLTGCESKEAPEPVVASPVERFSTTPVFEEPIVGKGLMERWGEERVTRMLTEFTAYVRAESWKIERLRPKADYTAADFSSVSTPMTFDLSFAWSGQLASALRGNEQDVEAVRALAVSKQLFVKMMMVNADGWAIDHFDGTWRILDALPE